MSKAASLQQEPDLTCSVLQAVLGSNPCRFVRWRDLGQICSKLKAQIQEACTSSVGQPYLDCLFRCMCQ